MKIKPYINAVIISIVALFTIACEDKKTTQGDMFSKAKTTQEEHRFSLTTTEGEVIEILVEEPQKIKVLSPKFQNKLILFDFWATWCPPCIQEIPHLVALYNKYKEHFIMIGILSQDDRDLDELKAFIKEYKIPYYITYKQKDNNAFFETLTNLWTLPFKSFFDANGSYISHYYGAIPQEILEAEIKKYIK